MIGSKQSALILISLVAAAFTTTSFVARPAFAQDAAAIDKLVQMNKKALDDYDMLEWDTAKRTLLDALMAGKKAGLESHPVVARTYVHLAAVYLTGFKNRDKAIQSFVRAIEIDPGIQLSKAIATAEVNDAFAEAQRKVKGGGGDSAPPASPAPGRRRKPVMDEDGGSAPPSGRAARSGRKRLGSDEDESGEPDLPAKINALECPSADETLLEKSVVVRCAVAPNLPVAKVFVMYRIPGKEEYVEAEMRKTPKGWLQATIPKKAVTGKSLQFYFEGRNAAGKPVVANGAETSPNIMLIVEEGAAEEQEQPGKKKKKKGAEEEEENPLEEKEGPYKPKLRLGRIDRAREGLDERFGKRKFWIGLGIGSGYGYAKGDGLETRPDLQDIFVPGLAWAGLAHLAPEFGYQINPGIAISLEGRLQYIPQPSTFAKFTASGALSALAKVIFYTKQSRVRFFGTAMAGGGEGFRFTVYPDTTRRTYKDTVRGGPFLGGLGGGVYYEAAKSLSIVLEGRALAGFPMVSVVGDLTLAFQFNIY